MTGLEILIGTCLGTVMVAWITAIFFTGVIGILNLVVLVMLGVEHLIYGDQGSDVKEFAKNVAIFLPISLVLLFGFSYLGAT